jgi:hypothetical protein
MFTNKTKCCIPCIEGLFTDQQYNKISKLIFTFAKWHALAKLRVHTESTLEALDSETSALGLRLRIFQRWTAAEFPSVVETNAEFEARKRRETRKAMALGLPVPEFAKEPKEHSLSTYKLHALGDYVKAIRRFGTTDSYSTQIVSHIIALSVSKSLTSWVHLGRARAPKTESSSQTYQPD